MGEIKSDREKDARDKRFLFQVSQARVLLIFCQCPKRRSFVSKGGGGKVLFQIAEAAELLFV